MPVGTQKVKDAIGIKVMLIDKVYGSQGGDQRFHRLIIQLRVLLWGDGGCPWLDGKHLSLWGFWDGLRKLAQ